jgi:hypothetical protein
MLHDSGSKTRYTRNVFGCIRAFEGGAQTRPFGLKIPILSLRRVGSREGVWKRRSMEEEE